MRLIQGLTKAFILLPLSIYSLLFIYLSPLSNTFANGFVMNVTKLKCDQNFKAQIKYILYMCIYSKFFVVEIA